MYRMRPVRVPVRILMHGEWYDATVYDICQPGGSFDHLLLYMVLYDPLPLDWCEDEWFYGPLHKKDVTYARVVNWAGDHSFQIILHDEDSGIDPPYDAYLYFESFTTADVEFYIKCIRGETVPQAGRVERLPGGASRQTKSIDTMEEARAHVRTILGDVPQPTHPILLINAVQNYDTTEHDNPNNDDEPTPSPYAFDFTVAAHQIRAFDLPGDGDFAIRARVFAFLW
jgi:hypothetical protein